MQTSCAGCVERSGMDIAMHSSRTQFDTSAPDIQERVQRHSLTNGQSWTTARPREWPSLKRTSATHPAPIVLSDQNI